MDEQQTKKDSQTSGQNPKTNITIIIKPKKILFLLYSKINYKHYNFYNIIVIKYYNVFKT